MVRFLGMDVEEGRLEETPGEGGNTQNCAESLHKFLTVSPIRWRVTADERERTDNMLDAIVSVATADPSIRARVATTECIPSRVHFALSFSGDDVLCAAHQASFPSKPRALAFSLPSRPGSSGSTSPSLSADGG